MNPLERAQKDPQFRASLSRALEAENGVVRDAIFAIKDSVSNSDVADNLDVIASVRLLSYRAGFHECLELLVGLVSPIAEPPPPLGQETWEKPE